ncbi:hypothetical protein [Streptomyces fungicidicus]|uniref:hypothetical protein n=1 Tax=Streptomyces fungicidicus TaxID=68203 RepID=UPI0036ADC3B6
MTVSLDKLTDPADSATAAALRLEVQRLTEALHLSEADLRRTQGALGSIEARYSNAVSALQREQEEARAAREKYGELRAKARNLLRDLVAEYSLEEYRQEISDKGEAIGLDALEYSYKGSVTIRFDFEGLRRRDGGEVTEDDVRAHLDYVLRTVGTLEDPDYYDYTVVEGETDLELE